MPDYDVLVKCHPKGYPEDEREDTVRIENAKDA